MRRTALICAAALCALAPPCPVGAAEPGGNGAAEPKAPPTPEQIGELVRSMAKDDLSGMVASRKLAEIGSPAVRQLLEATDHKVPRVRYWSIAALSSIGDEQGVPAIMRLLNDRDALVRCVAVWHLGRWFDRPEVQEAVLERLTDKQASVRGWTLRLLSEKRATDLGDRVLEVFNEDEDVEVRYDALTTFVRLQGADSLATLKKILREENEELIRQCAVRCCTLVEPRSAETGDLLIRALRDEDEEVRDMAATLLRKGYNQYFAFDPKAPGSEQNKARSQWRNWYEANKGRLKWNEQKRRFELPGEEADQPDEPRPPAE